MHNLSALPSTSRQNRIGLEDELADVVHHLVRSSLHHSELVRLHRAGDQHEVSDVDARDRVSAWPRGRARSPAVAFVVTAALRPIGPPHARAVL